MLFGFGVNFITRYRGKNFLWLALAVGILLLSSCQNQNNSGWIRSPAEIAKSPVPQTTATLLIFSGRPNPQWALAESQTQELLQQLESLPVSNPVDFSAGLGYQGYWVQIEFGGLPVRSLRIFQQQVEVVQGKQTAYYVDADRRLEQWLLLSAQPHIDQDIYELVVEAIQHFQTTSAATFQASFDPAHYSLPKMIAGYEIVAVISPENTTCLPLGMIQLVLKAPQPRVEDFLKNNQPDVVQQALNELDVAHHGQWTLGFVGPAITRDLVISETEKWNAAMKAGCETFGVPEAIATPASD